MIWNGKSLDVDRKLLVHVDQRRWRRHSFLNREAEAVGLTRTVVRVLPKYYNFSLFQIEMMGPTPNLIIKFCESFLGASSKQKVFKPDLQEGRPC